MYSVVIRIDNDCRAIFCSRTAVTEWYVPAWLSKERSFLCKLSPQPRWKSIILIPFHLRPPPIDHLDPLLRFHLYLGTFDDSILFNMNQCIGPPIGRRSISGRTEERVRPPSPCHHPLGNPSRAPSLLMPSISREFQHMFVRRRCHELLAGCSL